MARDEDRRIPLHDFRVEDLRECHEVIGTCVLCRHSAVIPRKLIQRRCGGRDFVKRLEDRLKCTQCGARGMNAITVRMLPRNA